MQQSHTILESNKQQKSHSELEQIRREEINIHRNQSQDLKPLKAAISEGEISNLLNLLCSNNSKCYNITLYNIQGLGIASSSMDKNFEQKIIKSRNDQFYIKILDKDLMKHFKSQTYIDDKNNRFVEYLKPVCMKGENNNHYFVFSQDPNCDKIIGYISYVLDLSTILPSQIQSPFIESPVTLTKKVEVGSDIR